MFCRWRFIIFAWDSQSSIESNSMEIVRLWFEQTSFSQRSVDSVWNFQLKSLWSPFQSTKKLQITYLMLHFFSILYETQTQKKTSLEFKNNMPALHLNRFLFFSFPFSQNIRKQRGIHFFSVHRNRHHIRVKKSIHIQTSIARFQFLAQFNPKNFRPQNFSAGKEQRTYVINNLMHTQNGWRGQPSRFYFELKFIYPIF